MSINVGRPPAGFKGWTMTAVNFHGFANLPTTRDEFVESPEFSCFGHQWVLKLYSGGKEDSDEGFVALRLVNRSNESIKIQYGYSARGSYGLEMVNHVNPVVNEFSAQSSIRDTPNFAERSELLDVLVDGSLVITVKMKLDSTPQLSTDKSISQFIPTNPLTKNVLQKFMDEESADVVFEVNNGSGQSDEHTNKKSKTTATVYAHRFILQDISTMLSELCKPADSGGDITTVSITDVKPAIFKHMIYYAYGGKLSDEDLKDNAKDIINACDKYGVVNLKLETEATYVKSTEITMDNMMDNLLYADSKNLALLKEAVMDYIVANKHSVMGKVSFSNVPGDIVTDVLAAFARDESQTTDAVEDDESIKYNKMRVATLRKMLDEKGLDVDGSREAMVALLKEYSA